MRWALVLTVLVPSLAMAQDEGSQLSAPRAGTADAETTPAELRARWRALGYDGEATQGDEATGGEATQVPAPVPAPPTSPNARPMPRFFPPHTDPYTLVRQERMQRRLEIHAQRRAASAARRERRVQRPFSLRLEAFWTITPRAVNGFGPYDGNDGYAGYPGGGVGLIGSKWLTRALRVDLRVAYAHIGRDIYLDENHGPEGSVGVALSLNSATRKRMGIGLGIDAVMAREYDAATGGHFRWLGIRGAVVAEMGFITQRGNGLVLKMAPTFTWAPYADHPFPGIISGLAVEWTP